MEPIQKPELPKDFGEYDKATNTFRAEQYGESCIQYGIMLALNYILNNQQAHNDLDEVREMTLKINKKISDIAHRIGGN